MSDITPYEHDSTYSIVPSAASLAEQIARSDFAPAGLRGKPEAVMAAMLQGHELGIGPMAALAEIGVINGKPCISAKLMRALVQRAGHDLWFEVKTSTKVTICGRRKDWPEDRVAKVTWTMDDAKTAGLSGGQNYRKYPAPCWPLEPRASYAGTTLPTFSEACPTPTRRSPMVIWWPTQTW
ncbi:MAG: hypothetical protein IPG97_16440 [Microthrixaceae bacterium]|nr:hypothetical protein [Microthrixaceae bacterium]